MAVDTTAASPEYISRPPVPSEALAHRDLREDEFWRRIPAYRNTDAAEFHDYRFQVRHSVTSPGRLADIVGRLVPPRFMEDVEQGISRSTMSFRLTPYILSLIDWQQPYEDPLRIQFVPLASRLLPDHPQVTLDALGEQQDSPAPGLTHRYFDRALFLALDTCPVYCRCCTRSYAVGLDTEGLSKLHFGAQRQRWDQAIEYIRSRPELEDVVVSGGDVANLGAASIERLGTCLLDIDHVRRIRYGTKGPAVIPQLMVTNDAWMTALLRVVEQGRRQHKQVVLHTHFNHPTEITAITRVGLDRLAENGVIVRNQTVLQRGVNDDIHTMRLLVQRLGYLNVQPYYVFAHDLVTGVEDLRTSLFTAMELEKEVRGLTSGFNSPTFVVDTPGGGGKRDVHSYTHYDREHGISVFTSPAVKPGKRFLYFDPLHALSDDARRRWEDPATRATLVQAARNAAPPD